MPSSVGVVDRQEPTRSVPPDEVLEALPDVYASVLVLLSEGADDELVSARLGVPREAVPVLIELAHRKAARVTAALRDGGYR